MRWLKEPQEGPLTRESREPIYVTLYGNYGVLLQYSPLNGQITRPLRVRLRKDVDPLKSNIP
jgi:hypothetical protein